MINDSAVRPPSSSVTPQTITPESDYPKLDLQGLTEPHSAPRTLTVFVAGRPAPQGSKRGIPTKHGRVAMVESSKAVKPWREDIRQALLVDGRPRTTFAGSVHVVLTFVMPRPASTPKRRTPPAIRRPDLDKLTRAVLDAISSAGVWIDDSYVTQLAASKRIAELDETPGCHITIQDA